MPPDVVLQLQEAHALLDMLPPDKVAVVRSLLEVLVEPLSQSLSLASIEEEDITEETAAALDRARDSLAKGAGIAHEEVMKQFGLRP